LIRNVRIECTENKGSRNGRGYATEKANFITLTVVLHEEGVAIDDVVVQVPRKLLVESPGNSVDEGGEYARLVVGPEAGLVIAHLRLRTILPEDSEKSHYIGILRDVSVSRINDASESGLEEGVTAATHASTEFDTQPIEAENDSAGLVRLGLSRSRCRC